MDHRRHTAVHEAGHAVIAHVLGLPPEVVSIVPNDDDASAGHCGVPSPHRVMSIWEERGYYRDEATALRAHIIASMAGREAEVEILGDTHGGDEEDRRDIGMFLESLYPFVADDEFLRREDRLRRFTRTLVRHHRRAIEAVAARLLDVEEMTADEVAAILTPQPAA